MVICRLKSFLALKGRDILAQDQEKRDLPPFQGQNYNMLKLKHITTSNYFLPDIIEKLQQFFSDFDRVNFWQLRQYILNIIVSH